MSGVQQKRCVSTKNGLKCIKECDNESDYCDRHISQSKKKNNAEGLNYIRRISFKGEEHE